MKKLFAVLLTVCLMLGMFSACSNGKDTVDDPANTGAENGLSVSKEPIKDLVTYVVASQEMSTFNILYSQSTNETQVLMLPLLSASMIISTLSSIRAYAFRDPIRSSGLVQITLAATTGARSGMPPRRPLSLLRSSP